MKSHEYRSNLFRLASAFWTATAVAYAMLGSGALWWLGRLIWKALG